MARWLIFFAAALAGLAISPAAAQGDAAPEAPIEQLKAEIEFHKAEAKYHRELWEKLDAEIQQLRTRFNSLEAPIQAKQSEARQREIDLNARLYAKYVEAKQREYDFASDMMRVNSYTFQHQYVAAYVVLALVVFIVVAALWFAHVQLMAGLAPARAIVQRKGAAPRETAPHVGSPPGEATPATASTPSVVTTSGAAPSPAPVDLGTRIDASLDKVTVTSSVVGVIVLLISLAFLYIYTKEIYTIRVVDPYQPRLQNPFDPLDSGRKSGGEKK